MISLYYTSILQLYSTNICCIIHKKSSQYTFIIHISNSNPCISLQSTCDLITEKVLSENSGKLLHFEAFKSLCKTQQVRIHSDKDYCVCLLALNVRQIVGLEFKVEKGLRQIHLIKIPSKI